MCPLFPFRNNAFCALPGKSCGLVETLRALIDAAGGEAIYLDAHMDGYYHSFYDDAFGCGIALGLAKAVLDSGYAPAKTLRFVFVGAEEWGSSNCESDWARGSYEQLNTVRPAWAADAFALLNIDDMFCPLGEKLAADLDALTALMEGVAALA